MIGNDFVFSMSGMFYDYFGVATRLYVLMYVDISG